jgi:hypothetical protein
MVMRSWVMMMKRMSVERIIHPRGRRSYIMIVEQRVEYAANWFDACPISENDHLKIGRDNARRLFRLGN